VIKKAVKREPAGVPGDGTLLRKMKARGSGKAGWEEERGKGLGPNQHLLSGCTGNLIDEWGEKKSRSGRL